MNRSIAAVVALAFLLLPCVGCGTAASNPEAGPTAWTNVFYGFWWLVGVAGSSLALYQAWQFFKWMESQPARPEKKPPERNASGTQPLCTPRPNDIQSKSTQTAPNTQY
ncbi:MAG: hypothetical protein ACKOHK_02280, partial [Planctomycetia bacterium]